MRLHRRRRFYTKRRAVRGATVSIFDNQAGRLRDLVEEAASRYPVRTQGIAPVLARLRSGELTAAAALADRDLGERLASEAMDHAAAGAAQAAYAWGRAAYVAQRRLAHAWLLPLRFAFAAGALQQTGLCVSGSARSSAIPRYIGQYWDRSIVPSDVAALIAGWAAHAGFGHTLFNNRTVRDYLTFHYGAAVRNAYDALPYPASKSDLFRIAWLLREGGIYVDADEQRVGDLNALLPDGADIVLNWTDAATPCVNNWFIASRPNHPLLASALDLALSHLVGTRGRGLGLPAWILTGPGVFSMAIMDLLCDRAAGADALAGLVFHSESDFRQVAVSPTDLAYKTDPRKNWRLNTSAW